MGVSLISFPDCLPQLPGFDIPLQQAFTSIYRERGSIFTGGASVLLFFVDVKRGRNKDIQKFMLFPYNELKIKIDSFQ